jgi:hypothetical protein
MIFINNIMIIVALVTLSAANVDKMVVSVGDTCVDEDCILKDGWMKNLYIVGECNDPSRCFNLHQYRGRIKSCEEGALCDLSDLPEHASCRLPSNGTMFKMGDGCTFCTTLSGDMSYCGLMVQGYSHQNISIASGWMFVKRGDNSFSFSPNIDNENIIWEGKLLYIVKENKECESLLLEWPRTRVQYDNFVLQQIQQGIVIRHQNKKAIGKVLKILFWMFVFGIFFC